MQWLHSWRALRALLALPLHIPDAGVILDVGANVGLFSLRVAQVNGSLTGSDSKSGPASACGSGGSGCEVPSRRHPVQVFAFEPNPATFVHLCKNLGERGLLRDGSVMCA